MGPTVFAKALEQRGFDSLWAPEHSHIPTTRGSSFPQGGDLPSKYYDVMDPVVTLGATAAERGPKPLRLRAGGPAYPVCSAGAAGPMPGSAPSPSPPPVTLDSLPSELFKGWEPVPVFLP